MEEVVDVAVPFPLIVEVVEAPPTSRVTGFEVDEEEEVDPLALAAAMLLDTPDIDPVE
jgi:hypothetical protein